MKDWNAESETTVAARQRIAGPVTDPDVLRALVSAVDASERPVIVVVPAVDAEGAVPYMVVLAEKLDARVDQSNVVTVLVSDADGLWDALRHSLADDRPTLPHVPVVDRSHKPY